MSVKSTTELGQEIADTLKECVSETSRPQLLDRLRDLLVSAQGKSYWVVLSQAIRATHVDIRKTTHASKSDFSRSARRH